MDYKEKVIALLNSQELSKEQKEKLENIFPELKEDESEDERIRKAIIAYISHGQHCGVSNVDMIAWLEKQKETNEEIIFRPIVGTDIRIAAKQALEKIDIGKKVVLAFNGAYILVNGKTVGEIDSEYDAWLEKQGEKKSADINGEDYGIDGLYHAIRILERTIGRVTGYQSDDGILEHKAAINAVKELYEKQSENKPADKTTPKFKVGDWIVFNGLTLHIDEVVNGYYRTTSRGNGIHNSYDWDIDNAARLWSIQDAKDGDVLTARECYVIFKEIDGLNIKCYCTYHYMGFNPSFHINTLQNKKAFHPATKEQRDLLFQQMKEAGYEWDSEKKELKKKD